jgi:predicted phosphodiesterase
MADESDSVIYKSFEPSRKGGAIDLTAKVSNNTRDNFFLSISQGEAITGSDRYRCYFVRNDNSVVNDASVFPFAPYFTGTGTEFVRQDDDDAKYDVSNWMISCWFKTSTSGSTMYIISKGGLYGTDLSGTNDSFSVRMDSTGHIVAGFEDGSGNNYYVTSFLAWNDGVWHFMVADYDHNNIELYIDDMTEPDETDFSADPEVNDLPIDIGRKSGDSTNYWIGNIDEVRVWNRSSAGFDERENLRLYSTASPSGLILENLFGDYTFTQDTLKNCVIYIQDNTISEDDEIQIGRGQSGLNQDEQIIATTSTPPVGVTFSLAETYNQGIWLGNLRPGDYQSFWLWRHLESNTTTEAKNKLELVIAFDPPAGTNGQGSGSGPGLPGGDNDGGSPNPTGNTGDYSFAVTGDWSLSSDAQDTADQIEKDPDVELTIDTGDNSYEDSGDKWADIVKDLLKDPMEMKMAFGNHDAKEGTPQPELTNFYLDLMGISNGGKRYYDFSYKNCYFIFVDFYTDWSINSTQYKWIKDKMEKAKGNSAYGWRILVFHEPMYTSPSHYGTNTKFATAYHPLMVANNFDFGMNGHNHNYMRTYPLSYNSGSPGSPQKVNEQQEPDYNNPQVPIFLQVGSAGRSSHRSFDGTASFSAKQQDSDYGWVKMSVSNNGRQMTGRFYKNNGQVFEKFTVIK